VPVWSGTAVINRENDMDRITIEPAIKIILGATRDKLAEAARKVGVADARAQAGAIGKAYQSRWIPSN
jgi:hypothetical protein